jgi:hypothetical protein
MKRTYVNRIQSLSTAAVNHIASIWITYGGDMVNMNMAYSLIQFSTGSYAQLTEG